MRRALQKRHANTLKSLHGRWDGGRKQQHLGRSHASAALVRMIGAMAVTRAGGGRARWWGVGTFQPIYNHAASFQFNVSVSSHLT